MKTAIYSKEPGRLAVAVTFDRVGNKVALYITIPALGIVECPASPAFLPTSQPGQYRHGLRFGRRVISISASFAKMIAQEVGAEQKRLEVVEAGL